MINKTTPQRFCLCHQDSHCRYLLGTSHSPELLVIGLNPSTADGFHSDNTWTKVMRIATDLGFESVAIANLYPLRCTHPALLPQKPNSALMQENVKQLRALPWSNIKSIWAAWGNGISARHYLTPALRLLMDSVNQRPWFHYGELTAGGHPRHPSRVGYHCPHHQFDINRYAVKREQQALRLN